MQPPPPEPKPHTGHPAPRLSGICPPGTLFPRPCSLPQGALQAPLLPVGAGHFPRVLITEAPSFPPQSPSPTPKRGKKEEGGGQGGEGPQGPRTGGWARWTREGEGCPAAVPRALLLVPCPQWGERGGSRTKRPCGAVRSRGQSWEGALRKAENSLDGRWGAAGRAGSPLSQPKGRTPGGKERGSREGTAWCAALSDRVGEEHSYICLHPAALAAPDSPACLTPSPGACTPQVRPWTAGTAPRVPSAALTAPSMGGLQPASWVVGRVHATCIRLTSGGSRLPGRRHT